MKPQDLQKLLDAGATQRQAEAALTAIEDANEAYEAFLCGVFDDIEQDSQPKRSKNTTPHGRGNGSDHGSADIALDDDDEDEVDQQEDHDLDSLTDATDKPQAIYDPYHGLTFVKDQKEVIVDTLPDPKKLSLMGRRVANAPLKHLCCHEVTSGQWMSGVPMGSEQSYLFETYQKLTTRPALCPGCGHSYPRADGLFMATWPTIPAFLDHLERVLNHTCLTCGITFCLACGEKVQSNSQMCVTKSKTIEHDDMGETDFARQALMHCSVVNSLIIGVGLMHLEGSWTTAPSKTTSKPAATAAHSGTQLESSSEDDAKSSAQHGCDKPTCLYCAGFKGGQMKSSSGTGFAGYASESRCWKVLQARKQKVKDDSDRKALELLRPYIPNPDRECLVNAQGTVIPTGPAEHDWLPSIVTIAQLRRRFLPLVSELLQSGSIAEITDRQALFTELLKWVRLFGQHANLASLVAQPIMRLTKASIRQDKNGQRVRVQEFVATDSPRAMAEEIVEQTKRLLRGLDKSSMETEEQDQDQELEQNAASGPSTHHQTSTSITKLKNKDSDGSLEKVRAFCESIIDSIGALDKALATVKGQDFVDAMKASYGASTSGAQTYAGDTKEIKSKRAESRHQQITSYNEWAKGIIFDEADMQMPGWTPEGSLPRYCHSFAKDIRVSAKLQNSRRNLAIAKEIALFRSSLPAEWDQAIFVRVDSARIDVMKALIVGPPCSPYKNGLFAFDIFLPENYKAVPPKVRITTTDGGAVRFGPNLYANGKVCLSLIGTWDGPGWTSDSTVLQVLLSITSMVMGLEEPSINEPGWEYNKGTEASLRYSKNLRRQTVRVAMKQMLENPPLPWEVVIKQYFKLKKTAIEQQLDDWLKEDDNYQTLADGAPLMRFPPSARYSHDNSGSFKGDVDDLKKLLAEL